jgi:hypothetical protein
MLPLDPKAHVRYPHRPEKATPLLQVASNHDCVLPPWGGGLESSGDGKIH